MAACSSCSPERASPPPPASTPTSRCSIVGLSSRFLDWVQLPPAWAWLANEWVMLVIGILLVLEIVADKIPAVDSVNDIIQTVVRPTAGGILFGTGTSSQTVAVTDPASFFTSNAWVPVAIGVVLSLVVHVGKTMARPAANAMTRRTRRAGAERRSRTSSASC